MNIYKTMKNLIRPAILRVQNLDNHRQMLILTEIINILFYKFNSIHHHILLNRSWSQCIAALKEYDVNYYQFYLHIFKSPSILFRDFKSTFIITINNQSYTFN